ncbi:hypothetical protein KIH74_24390 [Kineosporia sp. J2-2]|uniref:DUF8094 domain-containing protein n=1 Tax=Kineosporia corallincola TaxID=2835133 RepID=A0ABS5TM77_9ACTN|nr:hypothetical protein [Kineosporia corallincola]MBT0772105.1 hypothetical protein [Kineosporia corallincola]
MNREAGMKRRAALGLLLTPLVVAGCGQNTLVVTAPAADTQVHPVVEAGQARSILDAVDEAVAAGVGADDTTETADARLLGPYLAVLLARARVAEERDQKTDTPDEVTREALVVPRAHGWPRFFLAVGRTSSASTYLVRVLRSDSARAPYGLWAEAMMLPGASLPETATDASVLGADTDGLLLSPKEALAGFAGYLNGEGKGDGAENFRRSEYSDQLLQRLEADQKGLKEVATVSSKHVAVDETPLAMRTDDGGALVIGQLRQTYTVKVKPDSGKVKVKDADLAALAGGKDELQFGKSFTRSAVEVVVLHVPAKDSKERIRVVAAQKGDVEAEVK